MSETGLEEKVKNMNVEEKKPKAQKGGEKAKGEKKKKEDTSSGFPLEVSKVHSCDTRLAVMSHPRPPPWPICKLVHRKIPFFLWSNF